MKLKDLIKNKDYNCISYRLKMPDDKVRIYGESIFIGEAASKNGKLFSLDGDTIYDGDDVVMEFKEWSQPEENIKNGLTVVVDCGGG